jgi:hypothetical protein
MLDAIISAINDGHKTAAKNKKSIYSRMPLSNGFGDVYIKLEMGR